MSRTQESGGYLGGIGTMLEVADVCPSCGERHPEPQFGIRHGGPRECPKVILGSFPILDDPASDADPDAFLPQTAGRRIREYETPIQVSFGTPSVVRHEEVYPRARSLSVPWLRPPDLGEVL